MEIKKSDVLEERLTPERFQHGANSFHDPFQAVPGAVPKWSAERSTAILAQRVARFKWSSVVRWAITFVLLIGGGVGTFLVYNLRLVASMWILVAGLFCAIDGFHFLDRFYATQSRIILSVQCGAIVALIWWPCRRSFMITFLSCLLGFIAIRLFNSMWLAAENLAMSSIGVKALQLDGSGEWAKVWQAHGAAELRSVLLHVGYAPTRNELDTKLRTTWELGFITAQRLYQNAPVADPEEVKRLKARVNDAEERAKEMQGLADENRRSYLEANDELMSTNKLFQKLHQENEQLRKDLEESARKRAELEDQLIACAEQVDAAQESDQDESIEEVGYDRDMLVMEAGRLVEEDKLSIRKAAAELTKLAGKQVSATTVQRYVNEYRSKQKKS